MASLIACTHTFQLSRSRYKYSKSLKHVLCKSKGLPSAILPRFTPIGASNVLMGEYLAISNQDKMLITALGAESSYYSCKSALYNFVTMWYVPKQTVTAR